MLNTKTEYAIRGLVEVARKGNNKPVAIREICEKQHLPLKYMEQIFRSLKGAGLLKSIKGSCGGYLLYRPAEEITLKEIMTAINVRPARLDCCGQDGDREYCIGNPCTFYNVWEEIESELDNYLSKVTLKRFLIPGETK